LVPPWTSPSRSSRADRPSRRISATVPVPARPRGPSLDIGTVASFDHDGVDPFGVEQMGQEHARRSRPDYRHLCPVPHIHPLDCRPVRRLVPIMRLAMAACDGRAAQKLDDPVAAQ
jgi:hypothetical protein